MGTTEDKNRALFGLSNITGGANKEHVRYFMEEESLVERVIMLSNNDARQLKGEATWVLTNAISQSTEEDRALFVNTFNSDLINALCMRLRDLTDETSVIFEVL